MVTRAGEPTDSIDSAAGSGPHGSIASSDQTLAGDGSEPTRAGDDGLPAGATVGRYVVLGRVGAGAMGVVYTAHDPQLDRTVALKLLHARAQTDSSPSGRRRLLTEAQALARLNHPNVVTVHDVGEHEGQVFVAMELIEGVTLGKWLAVAKRPWAEILDTMAQAGRGLAAAHARGLVHRDFKPENMMIGDDGRVRVMDFGLARTTSIRPVLDDSSDVHATMRPPGTIVGTPAYAAPEQIGGQRGHATADQFSFCATLWEALYGQRPFVADTLAELISNVIAGAIVPPPAGASTPTWLRRIIERGLANKPEQRWESMDALLAALARGRTRAKQRRVAIVGASVVAVVLAVVGWRHQQAEARIAACKAEGATIGEVWNADVAAKLRGAMLATGKSHADVTAEKVTPWLDAHAQAWSDARGQACMYAEVEQTWDHETIDRSLWCLDERRIAFDALIRELLRGEPSSVANAVPAAAQLGRVEPCIDAAALARVSTPDASTRDAVIAVRDDLLRATALQDTGAYDDGLALARDVLGRAEAVGWPPLVAAARRRVGVLLEQRGEYAEAERTLEAAYFEAGRADATAIEAEAAYDLALVVGDRLTRHAEGFRWAHHQELALLRTPDPTGLLQAQHVEGLALLHQAKGEHAEALPLYERVLALREEALPPNHPEVLDTLGNLATLRYEMGEYEAAKQLNLQGLALREEALGPGHPAVGVSLNNLARDHRALGNNTDAEALYTRALAIWEASLPADHPHVAQVLHNLGNLRSSFGDYAGGTAFHLRALQIRERAFGKDHIQVAESLAALALLHHIEGKPATAKPLHERAIAIYETAVGTDSVELARFLGNFGLSLQRLGELDAAKAAQERAIAIRMRLLPPNHDFIALGHENLGSALRDLGELDAAKEHFDEALRIWAPGVGMGYLARAFALVGLAEIALIRGDTTTALRHAETALALRVTGDGPPGDLADSRYLVARVLVAAKTDVPRAIALAEQALEFYRDVQQSNEPDIEEWLSTHRAK